MLLMLSTDACWNGIWAYKFCFSYFVDGGRVMNFEFLLSGFLVWKWCDEACCWGSVYGVRVDWTFEVLVLWLWPCLLHGLWIIWWMVPCDGLWVSFISGFGLKIMLRHAFKVLFMLWGCWTFEVLVLWLWPCLLWEYVFEKKIMFWGLFERNMEYEA